MNFKTILSLAVVTAATATATATNPVWLEADSAAAIKSRLLHDFSLTYEQARQAINEKYNLNIDSAQMRVFADKHYIETRVIDGVERVHRKSPGNLSLLNPDMNGGWKARGGSASDKRISYVDSVLAYYDGNNALGAAHEVTYRFVIDVPYDESLKGDTLRVWMPVPITSARQSDVEILSTIPEEHIVSDPAKSFHSTVSMARPVTEGQPTHFEATVRFKNKGQYFSPEYIRRNIKPYDKNSELYKRYTAVEPPHVIHAADLAKEIVGNETDPFRQSELVYDYIINRYPWAGAREYSTIECIPQYVLDEGHGDCGQVSLLYISLMRSLGVPARWESGWMLHPGEKNLHDWAEVYFEGVGWVPVDVSFGRYTPASDPRAVNFYSTGMDAHRMASNLGVSGKFDPEKRFVRSETVDAQLGEVESTKGNLFYPGWDQHFQIIDIHPIGRDDAGSLQERTADAIAFTKAQYAPDKRQQIFEVAPSFADGHVAITGRVSEPATKAQLFNALKARGVDALDMVEVIPDTVWATSRISVAMNRLAPGHEQEMGTQCLMGMPLRVVDEDDGWYRVQTPDGYLSWVTGSSLVLKSDKEMAAWRKAPRLVVTNPYQTRAYYTSKGKGLRDVVTDLVNGDIVEGSLANPRNGRVEITLPDGRKAWVDVNDVTDINTWANQKFDAQKILDQAYSMEGSPYFWGGTSVKNLDCSGLAKVSYLSNGIILRRDASQQALTGKPIAAADWRSLEPGDLLFFGNARTGKVTHVAIHDNNGDYIHSSGRVKRNSVDPESPMYLTTPFLGAVRINGYEGTDGIVRAKDHPWYF